jgi:zinc-ribbon family
MLIIGTRFFVWGAELTSEQHHCVKCGRVGSFKIRKGMNFITLFFIIPIIPISGVKNILECPNCKTRYDARQV